MSLLNLKILTPESEVFSANVDKISATTPNGEIGILPNHEKILTSISAGVLHVTQNSKTSTLATGNGLLQVEDNQAILLTDMALEAKDIDEKAVEEASKRAKQALADKTLSEEEYATTLSVLENSLAQLKVKRRHHSV